VSPQQQVAHGASAERGHHGQHDHAKEVHLLAARGQDAANGGNGNGEMFEEKLHSEEDD
jgi:hypothetical protein